MYLDLHGAMVTRKYDDGEAEILRRIRDAAGYDLPIAVSLDLHGNLSKSFFDLADLSNQVSNEIWMSAGVGEERFNMTK